MNRLPYLPLACAFIASLYLLAPSTFAAPASAGAAGASLNTSSQTGSEAGFITRLLNKPVPGGVAVVNLGRHDQPPRAWYNQRPVMVLEENGSWIAVIGVPLSATVGQHHVTAETAQGKQRASFTVEARTYKEQHITLKNQRQVNPNPDDLKRIRRELAEQQEAYRQFTPRIPTNVHLDKPVPGRLTSPFGLRRFFNGEERNPHSGLDFAASSGTPIKSPAGGRIILVGDYFFNGKTVFVDHGQGFISMFCHLSAIDVNVGDDVQRGDILGKVGSTGRSTGPHLHWNVSLNDVRVDPSIFIGAFTP